MNKLSINLSPVTKHYTVPCNNGKSLIANVMSQANRYMLMASEGGL